MADRPRPGPTLAEVRQDLELIDRAIVLLLAERIRTAGIAIHCRSQFDGRVAHPVQEARVLARAREWGVSLRLSEELTDTIFRALIEEGKEQYLASLRLTVRSSSSPFEAKVPTPGLTPPVPVPRARATPPA